MDQDSLRAAPPNADEFDGWWKTHFFQPFTRLRSVVGPVYQDAVPPANFLQARDFARLLWMCCDDEDMHNLVQALPDGAAEFRFFVSVVSYEKLVRNPEARTSGEATAHKPFAVLSSVALGWMDEVEARAPGKTKPKPAR